MHTYHVSCATVLPIATNDIGGNTESQDFESNGQPTKSARLLAHDRIVMTSVNSNSNIGFAFPPHAQTLQPIAGSQRHLIKPKPAGPAEVQNPASAPSDAEAMMMAAAFDSAISPPVDPSSANSSTIPGAVAPEGKEVQPQTSSQSLEQPKMSLKAFRRATIENGQSKPRMQRKRSMSLQPAKAIELTKNYDHLVREFNMLRPFTRCPDGSYPRDTKCVICRRARPSSVFFPCQHRCVCDDCINSHRISADRSNPSNWWCVVPFAVVYVPNHKADLTKIAVVARAQSV